MNHPKNGKRLTYEYVKKYIEYNGTYWHSFKDAIKHDEIKKEQCEKLGINLLIVKEDNWQNNQLIEK